MSGRLRGQTVNVVLALVAVALVAVVLITRGRVTTGEREARENNVLPAFRENEIRNITIDKGASKVVLERGAQDDAGEASWQLTQPLREEAEAYAIDKLLGSLEFATWARRLKPEEVDRKAFGLDAPEWTLSIQMGDISYQLRLGKEAPTPKGARYLELVAEGAPGSGVGVIGRDLATELGMDASELRGRQVMPYLSSALERIVLEGAGGTRRLRSAGENRWKFENMQSNVRVDREALDRVLLQFARTKAEHFIDVGQAEQALAGAGDTTVRVTMIPKAEERPKGVVEVGGRCPKSDNDVVALRREPDPIAACVPRSVMPALATPAAELVDKSLFALRKDEVETLTVVREKDELALDRKESGFVLRKPVKADVELDVGNRHVDAIVRAAGTLLEKPDPAKLGLAPPQGRATVTSVAEDDAKVVEETLDVGKTTPGGGLYVRRKDDGAVLELDRDTARLLAADATLLRKKRVLDFAPADFRVADIQTPELHQRIRREPSAAFTLELPKGFSHDASLATTLVDVLGSLEADRWIASADDGSFGLASPLLSAKLELELGDGGTRTLTLAVGAASSGGHFAKLQGPGAPPGVFVIPRRAVETLQTPLLDRSLFLTSPEAAERVTLRRGDREVALERRGQSWVETSAGELSPGRVAQIVEALRSLRAEAAIHLGAAEPSEGFARPELVVRVDPVGTDEAWSFRIGAGDSWQGTSIHYARRDGVDATYAIARNKVRAILDAL